MDESTLEQITADVAAERAAFDTLTKEKNAIEQKIEAARNGNGDLNAVRDLRRRLPEVNAELAESQKRLTRLNVAQYEAELPIAAAAVPALAAEMDARRETAEAATAAFVQAQAAFDTAAARVRELTYTLNVARRYL
jgi:chromosome segregation ATPase